MNQRIYSRDHLWLEWEADGTATVGVTTYAQKELGDILFVELPEIGAELTQAPAFGVIESVKTASDLFAPASGRVTAVNEKLREEPWLVNDSPQEQGWILKMAAAAPETGDYLMDADAYRNLAGP